MRRLLPIAALALAFLGAAPAANAAVVRVIDTGRSESTVDLADLRGREDVVDRGYAVRSSSGERTETVTGFSLGMIIEESEADSISYGYAEIVRPSGGVVQLSNGQVRQSGAFPDGPPVVFERGADAAFLRPSTGSGDVNADDRVEASPLVVRLRSGSLIEVEATPSATKAKVGETITFNAVAEAPLGASVRYSWSFGDGTGAKGATATHEFERPGSYAVAVGATTADDPTGGSDVVRITVGRTRKGGPDREGGGSDRGENAADSGASDGTGGSPTGTVGGTGTEATSGDSGDAGGDPERGRRAPGLTTPVETVTGEVLRNPEAVEEQPTEETAPPTARTGTPEEESAGIPQAAIGAAAILTLFGLGALAELERLRPGRALARLLPGWGR